VRSLPAAGVGMPCLRSRPDLLREGLRRCNEGSRCDRRSEGIRAAWLRGLMGGEVRLQALKAVVRELEGLLGGMG